MQINDGKKLFQQGIDSFNKMRFYDAHEYWEELWLEYKLNDALFVQGLIQLAVSYFHFFNGNLKGAKSMAKKCLIKFDTFEIERGIDASKLKIDIVKLQESYEKIAEYSEKSDIYIIKLKVKY